MTRHIVAALVAARMFVSPAMALAQSDSATGTISTYSDTAPRKAAAPKKTSSTTKASAKKSVSKSRKSKKSGAKA